MDLNLKGKNVLITGASKGIGEEIANHFAKEGSNLLLIARDKAKLSKIINKFGGSKKGHSYIAVDLRKSRIPSKVAKQFIKRKKKIDIVVHNVGGALGSKEILADVREWINVWKFNVGIAIEMNNIILPLMRKKRWGRIIHISSLSAITGGTTSKGAAPAPSYTCAKSFLNMYTKVLGREVAKDNVIVSAVMPGVIFSKGKHWDKLNKKNPILIKNYIKSHQAVGRFGSAKEIVPFVLLLASDHASYAASSILSVDGGYH